MSTATSPTGPTDPEVDLDLAPIREVADAQGGVLTTGQLRLLGYDRNQLRRAVERRQLDHLGRSVYALPGLVDPSLSRPEQAVRRHALLARGLLLVYPDAVLTGHSALVAHGLPVFGADLSRVQLQRPLRHQVDTQTACIRALTCTPVITELGPAADVVTAVVQATLEHGMITGLVAADAALHAGSMTQQALEAEVRRVRGWHGSSATGAMLTHVDGRSESVGETRLRALCSTWAVTVVPQVEIRDDDGRFVARVDLVVEGTKVVLEFDGQGKYATEGLSALIAEKEREDRLRALGYVVVRVTWSDLASPSRLLARIRRAMAVA